MRVLKFALYLSLCFGLALSLITFASADSEKGSSANDAEPPEIWDVVNHLHEGFVMDLHTDTLLIIEALGYDFGKRHWPPFGFMPWMGHVDLPRAREAGVNAFFMGVVANPFWGDGRAQIRETLRVGHEEVLDRYPEEVELAWSAADITAITHKGKVAVQFLVEGAHGLGENKEEALPFLDELYQKGVRSIGLAHFTDNKFAASSASSEPDVPGLSEDGRAIVKRMNEMGIAIDLSHVHPESFRDVILMTKAPVFLSHTGIAAKKKVFRNIEDWQIHAVAKTGGVIGVMYAPTWLSSDMLPPVQAIVDHMKHVKDLVGAEHIALGSDYDGFIWLPKGMDDITDLPKLTKALLEADFTPEEVEGILGGNILRYLKSVEKHATARPEKL